MPDRPAHALRPVTIEPFDTAAAGSVLISQGDTRVLCTASLAAEAPPWVERDAIGRPIHGWVTADYAMLPGSTPDRKRRGPDGRATEIGRLIGRSLRAAVDLRLMPGLTVAVDCDVLKADGGTRTAAITGGFVALRQALDVARQRRLLGDEGGGPIRSPVAAVSVGIVDSTPMLDLDYDLDSRADTDLNVVMNAEGKFIEIQGTAERAPFSRAELDALLDLAAGGIRELIQLGNTRCRAA